MVAVLMLDVAVVWLPKALVALPLLAYAALIIWYRQHWFRLAAAPVDLEPACCHTKVTVLVPARNEAGNIERCLLALMAQQYPLQLWEVIVIDDASTDDTLAIVHRFEARFSNLRSIALPLHVVHAHKKRALAAGIAIASGSLVVCTDADCTMGPHWLASLVHAHEQGAVLVAAPVMYTTQATLLSVFQTLDMLSLQAITGASVGSGLHAMCNGANFAYTKAAFEAVNGFEGIDRQPTGDDMLLMHKILAAGLGHAVWLKQRSALVTTAAVATWYDFFQQRIRWASKAAFFADKRVFYVLLLVYGVNVSMVLLALACFFWPAYRSFWLGALGFKTAVELALMVPVARFFDKLPWLWLFPCLQPLHILYTVVAGWLGRFGSYRWKGRTVRTPLGRG
jgi:cellulose synthase/poly-beta-1,6-N-acetylglucosamine synthase-like glycosyltransferase